MFGFALIIDKDGEPDPARRRADVRHQHGRGPAARREPAPSVRAARRPGPDEVAIDARTARAGRLPSSATGSTSCFEDGRRTFTLVGIVGFGETDSLLGATMAGFDLATAQRVLDKVGRGRRGRRAGRRTASVRRELRDRIAGGASRRCRGRDGRAGGRGRDRPPSATRWGSSPRCCWCSPGVALLVGSFVIWNTFNVLVAQRRREVALLRAVGATRRQVLGGVLVGGRVDRAGVRRARASSSASGWPSASAPCSGSSGSRCRRTSAAIEPRTVVVALVVGLVVTVVAADAPGLGGDAGGSDGGAARRRAGAQRAAGGSGTSAGWTVLGRRRGAPACAVRGQPALVDGGRHPDGVRRPGRSSDRRSPAAWRGSPTTGGAAAAGGWRPATSAATRVVRPPPRWR